MKNEERLCTSNEIFCSIIYIYSKSSFQKRKYRLCDKIILSEDLLGTVVGAVVAFVILLAVFWLVRREKKKEPEFYEENRKSFNRFFLVFLTVVFAAFFVTNMFSDSFFFIMCLGAISVAALTYSILSMKFPMRRKCSDKVFDGFPKDSPTVSICVSKYVFTDRRPFQVFVDGTKIAEIFRGKEVSVHIPEGTHEFLAYQYKKMGGLLAKAKETIDVQNGLGLCIWQDDNKYRPLRIGAIPLDRTAFEEGQRIVQKKQIRFLWVLVAVLVTTYTILFIVTQMPI
ncbi:MAG: hypothetical protein FWC52_03030 [Candidatus Methanoplasma sp.]|nr:hypothetical protein [Candidatus Methanoplasma sp.]